MGENTRSVPTIDLLQDFHENHEKLRKACEDWGCFRVVNHKISLSLMAEMKKVARELLDLPDEVKKCNINVIPGSGHIPSSQVNPHYEALGLYDMGSSQAVDTFCSQLDASPHQREIIEMYAQAINGLAMEVAGKMAESMGLSGDLFKEWPYGFRINKYNFNQETVGSSGVQLHTDTAFLNILQDDENVGGLEVMDNKSGEFVAIDPAPGTFVVNVGDLAHAWSNGRFHNVKHKVECKEAAIRISIASYLLVPKEANVEAPAELVDSDHLRLYVPFTFEEYRKLVVTTKMHVGEALALLRTNSSTQ